MLYYSPLIKSSHHILMSLCSVARMDVLKEIHKLITYSTSKCFCDTN